MWQNGVEISEATLYKLQGGKQWELLSPKCSIIVRTETQLSLVDTKDPTKVHELTFSKGAFKQNDSSFVVQCLEGVFTIRLLQRDRLTSFLQYLNDMKTTLDHSTLRKVSTPVHQQLAFQQPLPQQQKPVQQNLMLASPNPTEANLYQPVAKLTQQQVIQQQAAELAHLFKQQQIHQQNQQQQQQAFVSPSLQRQQLFPQVVADNKHQPDVRLRNNFQSIDQEEPIMPPSMLNSQQANLYSTLQRPLQQRPLQQRPLQQAKSMESLISPPGSLEPTATTPAVVNPNNVPDGIFKQLEDSIASGNVEQAKEIAGRLAGEQTQISVVFDRERTINVNVDIEDLLGYQASLKIEINPYLMNVKKLKEKMRRELNFEPSIQNWIVNNELLSEDAKLSDHEVTRAGTQLYLVLTSHNITDNDKSTQTDQFAYVAGQIQPYTSIARDIQQVREEEANWEEFQQEQDGFAGMQRLLEMDVIPNTEKFECTICMTEIEAGDGVMLRECLHTFCRDCLAGTINSCGKPEVPCPSFGDYDCTAVLTHMEVKGIIGGDGFAGFLDKTLQLAENTFANSFHCRTPNCKGWCIYGDDNNFFECDLCMKRNCLTCNAIHEDITCKEYQDNLLRDSVNNEAAKKTQELFEELLRKGDAMRCPTCKIMVQKKQGCDWIKCTMCLSELCWATKGLRWGPKGNGDITGGCKCGVNGARCSEDCKNCH